MNVLVFTHIFPRHGRPIRGPYMGHIVRSLMRYCSVRVVGPEPFWSRAPMLGKRFGLVEDTSSGVSAHFLPYWSIPGIPVFHGAAAYFSLRRHIRKLREEFPFDLIFAAWAYPDATAAAWIARECDCPLIVRAMGSDVNVIPRSPLLRPQIRQALRRADSIVAVSSALKSRLVDLGIEPDRVIVQHNAVDGKLFHIRPVSECRDRLNLPPGRTIALYVGNLVREKGVDVLLSAFARVAANQPKLELYLVGRGPECAALKAQAAGLGLKQVHFIGAVAPAEVAWWMGAADFLCLPSRREGCPNVVLEALASGKPVVASAVGGIPEILSPASGFLIPPDDISALSDVIERVGQQFWDAAALRSSVECHSWDIVGDHIFQLFQNAMRS